MINKLSSERQAESLSAGAVLKAPSMMIWVIGKQVYKEPRSSKDAWIPKKGGPVQVKDEEKNSIISNY